MPFHWIPPLTVTSVYAARNYQQRLMREAALGAQAQTRNGQGPHPDSRTYCTTELTHNTQVAEKNTRALCVQLQQIADSLEGLKEFVPMLHQLSERLREELQQMDTIRALDEQPPTLRAGCQVSGAQTSTMSRITLNRNQQTPSGMKADTDDSTNV